MEGGAWWAPCGRKRVGHDLSTEQQQKQQQSAGSDQTQSDCGHKDGGNKEGGSGKERAMSRFTGRTTCMLSGEETEQRKSLRDDLRHHFKMKCTTRWPIHMV